MTVQKKDKKLKLMKDLAIEVRGRFRISKQVISKVTTELGEDYVERRSSSGKSRLYAIRALSFREIDKNKVLSEQVSISHCEDAVYHFEYFTSAVDKRSLQKKGQRIKYDDDVHRILTVLSPMKAKQLNLYFILPSVAFKRPEMKALKLGNLAVGGMRLMLGSAPKREDSVILDWGNRSSVRPRVCLTRKIRICSEWPVALLEHLKGLLKTLSELDLVP